VCTLRESLGLEKHIDCAEAHLLYVGIGRLILGDGHGVHLVHNLTAVHLPW
jgi:hypothetical protein